MISIVIINKISCFHFIYRFFEKKKKKKRKKKLTSIQKINLIMLSRVLHRAVLTSNIQVILNLIIYQSSIMLRSLFNYHRSLVIFNVHWAFSVVEHRKKLEIDRNVICNDFFFVNNYS